MSILKLPRFLWTFIPRLGTYKKANIAVIFKTKQNKPKAAV